MDKKFMIPFFWFILCFVYNAESKSKCITPIGPYKQRNRNDVGRYIIDIPGNPKTYTPNQRYNVSLKLNPLSRTPRSFKNFMITLEPEVDESMVDVDNINQAVGHFQFGYDTLSMFSSACPNTVIESNALLKTEVQLYWIAPPKNSGCVSIRATVIESKENWFSEDGPLTKILCEESSENENTQPPVLKHCCACDEAKYEIAFEGMWTRNTHPRDFPSDVWSTKFSEIIGASHRIEQSFWKYGDIASDGLRDLSEMGSTKTLESELKDMSENIRTIIKAKGLQYPNITLTSFAVFRVDNQNHLVSVVSKIMPSPDWIVGVSNLELCRSDCTWEESRILNLYPWDAGTDDGITYISSNEPSLPRQPIRRIKPNSPNDPRSPFYDENGEDMKPIAKLRLTRQRLYEKVCDEDSLRSPTEEDDYNSPCATTDWWEWSACSAACGEGVKFRQRQYLNPENAEQCSKRLVEKQSCYGESRNCGNTHNSHETEDNNNDSGSSHVEEDERCELGEWSEWSSCTAMCGKGTKTRDRKYKHKKYANFCGSSPEDLQENAECEGTGECENYEEPEIDAKCLSWLEWSLCNATCGTGFKVRFRMFGENDIEDEECQNVPRQEIVECYEPPCEEEPFGQIKSENQIKYPHVIAEGPVRRMIDCKVTKWSQWSPCQIKNGESCGEGYSLRVRSIKVNSANGGRPCPNKLLKRKPCSIPCQNSEEDTRSMLPTWGPAEDPSNAENSETECVMSEWSAWSPCSTICGGSSFRQRTRYVVSQPEGVSCPTRIQQKRCPLPLACTETGEAPMF